MHCEVELKHRVLVLSNIRLDRAGENSSNIVQYFCMTNGIRIDNSPAYASQINWVVEMMIGKHSTRARVLLKAANLPNFLWGEILSHGSWLRNRLPASRISNKLPILSGCPRLGSTSRRYSSLVQKVTLSSISLISCQVFRAWLLRRHGKNYTSTSSLYSFKQTYHLLLSS